MPKTTVKATGNGITVKGSSGSGPQVGFLLRTCKSRNPDAKLFYNMLVRLNEKRPRGRRSYFSCAEPHAVALLLAKGVKLEQIKIGTANQNHLGRTIMECPNCSEWIFNGSVAPPSFDSDESFSDYECERSAVLSNHEDVVATSYKIVDSDFPTLAESMSIQSKRKQRK